MKDVLFITPGIYPLNGGRQMASFGYCEELSKIANLNVLSVLENGIDKDQAINFMKKNHLKTEFFFSKSHNFFRYMLYKPYNKLLGKFLYMTPLYKECINSIQKSINKKKPDIIIIDHFVMYFYFVYLKKRCPQIHYIYHSHNVEYMNTEKEHSDNIYTINDRLKNIILKLKNKIRKSMEKRLISEADTTWCISKSDIYNLEKEFNLQNQSQKHLFAKPFVHFDLVKNRKDLVRYSKKLLIVGSMNWFPNVTGILWFIEYVLTELIAEDSAYKLFVVGKDPHPMLINEVQKYPDNIVLTGCVPSTNKYFDFCDISIVPVFEGTGAKIKVLESIGRGIPTICTSFAAKDYDTDTALVIADNKQEFIAQIKKIESSVDYRQMLYDKMKTYYSHYFELNPEIERLFIS